MRVKLFTLIAVALMMVASGYLIGYMIQPPTAGHDHGPGHTDPRAANQIETIFLALDQTQFDVPVDRAGSGGALASWEDSLIVMTHEGNFFDVTSDEAIRLEIAAPPNGWDDMLAFAEANEEYDFAHYTVRYNDVDLRDDQLIVSYTQWVADRECYRTAIATAEVTSLADTRITPEDWTVAFATEPCLAPSRTGRAIQGHMAGGRFDIDAAGRVILAVGDYAIDGNYNANAIAQDPSQQYGKVLAIDLAAGTAEQLSQGHSNPQGLTVTDTGEIYTVEHGRRGGDELNRIIPGSDFGWPQVSLGTRYNRLPLPNTQDYGHHPGFPLPVFAWLPSVAPSALMQIDGFDPSWDGDLLVATLAAQELIRVRIADGRVLFDERIPVGSRIRHVHQHGETIALWTDQEQVIKLTVGGFDPSTQFALEKISGLELGDRQKTQTEIILNHCLECHSLGVVEGGNAPALGMVYGREIGTGDFDYSDALANRDDTWTTENLAEYLADPEGFASGTMMPDLQIEDPEVIAGIVQILAALRLQPE